MPADVALVVEDNPDVLEFARDALVELGLSVRTAHSPEAALSVLRAESVDILLTDVRFAGAIDGIELARLASDLQPEIRVLCMTGDIGSGRAGGWPAVNARFLMKPFRLGQLQDEIRNLGGGGA